VLPPKYIEVSLHLYTLDLSPTLSEQFLGAKIPASVYDCLLHPLRFAGWALLTIGAGALRRQLFALLKGPQDLGSNVNGWKSLQAAALRGCIVFFGDQAGVPSATAVQQKRIVASHAARDNLAFRA
jgi:hypothetical protein